MIRVRALGWRFFAPINLVASLMLCRLVAYMRADKQLSETERQKNFGKFTGTSDP